MGKDRFEDFCSSKNFVVFIVDMIGLIEVRMFCCILQQGTISTYSKCGGFYNSSGEE